MPPFGTMEKKSFKIVILMSIVTVFIAFLSLSFAWGYEEQPFGILEECSVKVFLFLSFPWYNFKSNGLISESNYISLIFINCFLYGFILERIVYWRFISKKI